MLDQLQKVIGRVVTGVRPSGETLRVTAAQVAELRRNRPVLLFAENKGQSR